MRVIGLGLALLLCAGAGAAAAQPAPPGAPGSGLGIRLLDAPTERRDDPRARVYIVDHVAPGAAFSRRVEVVNDTGRAAEVALYPAASEIRDGSFDVLPDRAENQLTDWMQVTPEVLELEAGEAGMATVRIEVPTDAGGGERFAAVMAQVVGRSSQQGIAVASRVGIRVYLSVGGEAEPQSDFSVTTLQAVRRSDGRPAVTAQVRNTGGRALDMSGSLVLEDGPGGLSAGPFPAELGTTLAPGETSPVAVILDEAITGGPWAATLTLRSGRVEKAVTASLTFPDQSGEETRPVAAVPVPVTEDLDVLVPLAGSLIALTVLLLLLWLFWRRRNRSEDEPARAAADV